MKKLLFIALAAASLTACKQKIENKPVQYFPLEDVRLLDSEFKNAQEQDIKYLLTLDADRLLAPFLREAGLEPKAESYPNWENTGLDGHIGGHYLTALSLMYASTGNAEIKQRLDYMISELKQCQDANGNGYIGGVPGGNPMWDEIDKGEIHAGAFSLNGKWVPLYNIHKTYAGLRDAYLYAHSEEAKLMLVKMTDWMYNITKDLSDDQVQDMLRSEHGGLNETFADVAEITGNNKYLELAERFSHREILDPLMQRKDDLTGKHANTQIPKVIGYERVGELTGDTAWINASKYFWDIVVKDRSVAIGGNSVREHFHPSNNFSSMLQSVEGPETCNTYNMLKLSRMLFQSDGNDSRYMDYYEKALYNHILASINPKNGGLVYFTPMRPNHYRVYSQPETSFWCCVGSGIENPGKYGEMIYAYSDQSFYVNLFIPSKVTWKEKETEIVQETKFPDSEKLTLTINPENPTPFHIKVRYPSWVNEGELTFEVNGRKVRYATTENGYAVVNRTWNKGDVVTVTLPMHVRVEQLPDGSPEFAFEYGPIVLAAKTGTQDLKGLYADASRMGHIANGTMVPLKDKPFVIGEESELTSDVVPVEGKPMTFTLNNVFPDSYKPVELVPFYRIHEARYNVYWERATEAQLQEKLEKIKLDEQKQMALDGVTIDKVNCGEQQPESDHFIKDNQSWIGYRFEKHYRETSNWFSYQLKNPEKNARFVYIEYFDVDRRRSCEIQLNGTSIKTYAVNGAGKEDSFVDIIEIPEALQGAGKLEFKMQAIDKQWSFKLIEVRLLSSKEGIE